jgi:hypothetical protein
VVAPAAKCYSYGRPVKCHPGKSLYFKQVDGGLVFAFCLLLALVIFFCWMLPELRRDKKASDA